ncbi:divalent-cation tolerance protein CutA [Shewanella psychrotolerans]|uniref:divalent-cation tolerance protein CutA n=1 Tax=Shewanella psychrotolerans TaxID=2864206 RepID=UPI001C66222F|nr:divalent-cation tolerance protein CutA [Shewanella psychrotolerans]QYK00956.1 divalent-cation tolerance protein CutA [Shewanella psychrotolerans]
MHNSYLLVITTCPDKEIAGNIARALVSAKLAACVQISSPVISVYSWQDELCQEPEFSLQIKCHSQHYNEIAKLILSMHPYDVPELIALEIANGSPAYLDWIKETTQI